MYVRLKGKGKSEIKTFMMAPFFEVSKIHKKDMDKAFYYENSELHDFLEKWLDKTKESDSKSIYLQWLLKKKDIDKMSKS